MIQERLEQVIKNLQALEQSVDSRSVAKGILADIETLKDISQSLVTNPGYRLVRVDDENSFFFNNTPQLLAKHPGVAEDGLVVSRDVLSALQFNNFEHQIAVAHLIETHPDGLVVSRDGLPALRFKRREQHSVDGLSGPATHDQEIIDSFKFVVKIAWLNDVSVEADKNKNTGDRNVDVAQFVKDTMEKARFGVPSAYGIYMESLNKHDAAKVNRICMTFVYNLINTVTMSFTNYSQLAAYIHGFNGELADYTHTHY